MNESTADFICTAVTIGFLKAKPDTKFIYEVPGDRKNHEVLQKALQCVDLQVHVNGGQGQAGVNTIVISQQAAKMNQPLIITRPGGSVDQATIERIGKRLKGVTAFFEQQFDKMIYKKKQDGKVVSENLPGAYIGGLLTGDLNGELILNIMTPSNLFVRKPFTEVHKDNYRKIQVSYDGYVAIRTKLAEILTKMPGSFQGKVIALADVVTDQFEEIKGGQVFSSCHGLITSLFYRDTPKGAFHVEYSLGHSTCKVASCLPCSMFAVSNRSPAHATHFGRGDNWNFPKGVYRAYALLCEAASVNERMFRYIHLSSKKNSQIVFKNELLTPV